MPPKGNPKGKGLSGAAAPQVGRAARPSRVSLVGRPPFLNKDEDNITELGDGHEDDWTQPKTLVKPEDQLQLNDQELKEEFTRILTANNPHAPQNIVRYSFKERQYKQTSSVDQLAIHFALDGNMIHKESDEATRQLAKAQGGEGKVRYESEPPSEQAASEAAEEKPAGEQAAEGEGEKTEEEQQEAKDAEQEGQDDTTADDGTTTPAPTEGGKKLTNQFNFSERASQTYNNPLRERGTVTEPPPRATYSSNVTQWEIYDAYQEDFEKQEKNKEKKVIPGRKEEETKKKKVPTATLR